MSCVEVYTLQLKRGGRVHEAKSLDLLGGKTNKQIQVGYK